MNIRKNIPNILTFVRLVCAPIILALSIIYEGQYLISLGMLVVFGVTIVTDFLDGKLARKYGYESKFGAIMDPIADSTFYLSLLFGLQANDLFSFSIIFPMLILYREIAINILRRFADNKNILLSANWSGKLKMYLQSICFYFFLLTLNLKDSVCIDISMHTLNNYLSGIVMITALLNILSLGVYLTRLPSLFKMKKG
jgi:CDP-diacylglycerol--glycerol-3-phosphate 3-phosphatidyltransferase